VPAIKFRQICDKRLGKSSEEMREEVAAARAIQMRRFSGKDIVANAQMSPKMVRAFAPLDDESEMLLGQAMKDVGLSARAHDRILKVSRTIADLDGNEKIESVQLMEAIQYRSLDRAYRA
jgi:magnesium chelatase family protein